MESQGDQSINYKVGMAYYGDETLYKNMVSSFDAMSLDPGTQAIHNGWKLKDWEACHKEAKKLKGACVCNTPFILQKLRC
jgi:hypothetical protein